VDAAALLRSALVALAAREDAERGDRELDDVAIDALVSDATQSLSADPDDPTWRLADRIAKLRDVEPDSVELAVDWLDALLRRRGPGGPGSRPAR